MTEKLETMESLKAYKKELEQLLEALEAERAEHLQYKNFKADTFSYDEYAEKQRRIAAEFEASQQGRKYPPTHITFEELVYCLIKEGKSPANYEILGNASVYGYDGYVVKHGNAGNGFDVFYMERGQYTLLGHCKNEHDTCVAMLKLFARDNQRLKQYIR